MNELTSAAIQAQPQNLDRFFLKHFVQRMQPQQGATPKAQPSCYARKVLPPEAYMAKRQAEIEDLLTLALNEAIEALAENPAGFLMRFFMKRVEQPHSSGVSTLKRMTALTRGWHRTHAAPDMLLTAQVRQFEDWLLGFKAHSEQTTFAMGSKHYSVSTARVDACEESKTEVFVDVNDQNAIAIAMYSVNVAKFGALMAEPEMVEMMSDAFVSQHAPLVMSVMPGEIPQRRLDLFFTYEVDDVQVWIEGFKAHAHSRRGSWQVDALYMRSEVCDEARTRVFHSAYRPRVVGAMLMDADVGKLAEMIADPSFEHISRVLGFRIENMSIKVLGPPPPNM